VKFQLTRDVTQTECDWLRKTFKKGDIVYKFYGATYGCISPNGIAITEDSNGGNPFIELPRDALKNIDD